MTPSTRRWPSYDPDDLDAPVGSELAAALPATGAADELAALRQQVAQARDRERAWRAVSDTVRDLTILREPDRVLQAIVERSRVLLGSHIGWIAGPDAEHDGELAVLAIDGVSTEWAKLMRATRGRGAAGYVQRTRSPFSTSDYFAEERIAHDPQIDATLRSEGVQSMIAVPMLAGTQFVGVLVLADRSAREYTHPDIATLGMLAAHAVVAVGNAQAHAKTRAALAQAERSNTLLAQQSAALEMAAEAHERLTRLVAQGGTQADVCRTLASLLGAEVVVVDGADAVLCSAGPEGAGVADAGAELARRLGALALHTALDDSRISGRSVALRVGTAQRQGRLAAIVGGSRLLGGLLVLSATPLSDVAVRTLERSALVMAVMLLARRLPSDAQGVDTPTLLADLLHPLRTGSAALAGQAAARGLAPDTATVLALLEVAAEGSNAAATTAAVQRRLQARLDDARALVGQLDGRIVVLCAGLGPEELRQALLKALADKPRLAAGGLVSARCDTLAALPQRFAALHGGLALLRALAASDPGAEVPIRLADELAPYLAVFGHDAPAGASAQAFVDASIGALVAHDRARGTQLARSLLMYLDLGCSAKAAASRLGLHVNTLHNRLAAAAALLGPWDLPGRRLALHLALQLHALRAPA